MRKNVAGFVTLLTLCSIVAFSSATQPSSKTWIDMNDFAELSLWNSQTNSEGTYRTISFGGRTWLTAGYDYSTDGMVLLCSPQDSYGRMVFDSDTQSNYANIYSSSDIRNYLSGDALSAFSDAEQKLMLTTHGKYLHSDGDKLYLPNGEDGGRYFTVGADDDISISITSGPYRNVSDRYWLRAPYITGGKALAVSPGYYITHTTTDVYNKYFIIPAFCLNINNVLFASSASPATSSKAFSESNIMTLRHEDVGCINSEAFYTEDTILVSGETENLYLYVQGSDETGDFVYSIKAENGLSLPSSAIGRDLDITTCRIWLELFDEDSKLIYSKMARKYIPSENIELDCTEVNIPVNTSYSINATIYPDNSSLKEIQWTSENEKVAIVNEGIVTMLEPGTTRIIATTVDGQISSCVVTSLHTIKWIDGEEEIRTELKPYGSMIEILAEIPKKEGCLFLNWTTDGGEISDSYLVTKDLTVSALWFSKSGSCGDDVSYVLDDEGILTIAGEGIVADKAFIKNSWIKAVIIETGVIGIGNSAFENCKNLFTITIPDEITLSSNAFAGTSLIKVVFTGNAPLGVTEKSFSTNTVLYISFRAKGFDVYPWTQFRLVQTRPFSELFNPGMQSLDLPVSLKQIASKAFYNNELVVAVYLHDEIMQIGELAFADCQNLYGIRIPQSVGRNNIAKNAFQNSINVVIYGAANSGAEEFARNNGIPFEPINE